MAAPFLLLLLLLQRLLASGNASASDLDSLAGGGAPAAKALRISHRHHLDNGHAHSDVSASGAHPPRAGHSANATAPAIPEVAADLSSTLAFDCTLFAAACLVWKVLHLAGLVPPRSGGREHECHSTMSRNYLCFLQNCRDMFIVLTVVSAAATMPCWGPSPITAGIVGHGAFSTTAGGASGAVGLSVLCMETLLRGVIALVFVERLSRGVRKPLVPAGELDALQRTLWFSGLPAYDSGTGAPFLFDGEGLGQVAEDLTSAINRHLERSTLGLFTDAGMNVQVLPVMDRWSAVSRSLRSAHERKEAWLALVNVHRPGCWGSFVTRCYVQKLERAQLEEAKLQKEFQDIVLGPKMVSGAAFVTFAKHEHRNIFLQKKPRCWELRSHTYFSFGRPPFASVTLECTRASHPSDVNWHNLHITRNEQRARGVALTFFLFWAMIVITTPITTGSEVGSIAPAAKEQLAAMANRLHANHLVSGHAASLWSAVSKQLPAFFLVAVNALVLPECIYRVAGAIQPHRRSSVEVVQLHLNYAFLILNTMVIPFLGLTSIAAVVDWAGHKMKIPLSQLMPQLIHRVLQTHGVFALKYILSSACLTNTSSLMQIPQYLCRAWARKAAVSLRERIEAEEPWQFAWGYWYAWTLSVFTLSICASSLIPGTLPCAALFFAVQHSVDKHNLTHEIYAHGTFETENLFVIRALHYMRCIVATWWSLMGWTFFFTAYERSAHGMWDSRVPAWCIRMGGLLLVAMSIGLVVYSWIHEQLLLHESNFQSVDLASAPTAWSTTPFFQWAFRRIDEASQLFRDPEYQPLELERTDGEGSGSPHKWRRACTMGAAAAPLQAATLLTEGPMLGSRSKADSPSKRREALSWAAEVAVLSSYLQRRKAGASDPL